MIVRLSNSVFFFRSVAAVVAPDLGAQGEKFSGHSVLRGGCPDGVMLDEHDLQLVKFLYGDTLPSLYRILRNGGSVGATQANKQL